MALLSVAAATAQQTAPPAYTGTGIEWQLKKGKYYLKSVLPHSPADGKIPATAMKKTWLASVKNETTGKSYAVGGGEQDLLAAVTGPEQSVCRMELVLPGKKDRITVTVPFGCCAWLACAVFPRSASHWQKARAHRSGSPCWDPPGVIAAWSLWPPASWPKLSTDRGQNSRPDPMVKFCP